MKLSSSNVLEYLVNLGICHEQNRQSVNINAESIKGSNHLIVLRVRFPSGRHLLIKQDHNHHHSDPENLMNKEWNFQTQLLHNSQDLSLSSFVNFKIIHFDAIDSIIIYECVEDLIDLKNYYTKHKTFPREIAELTGATLGSLHQESLNSVICYNFLNQTVENKPCYKFPYPSHLLNRVSMETLIGEFLPQGFRFLVLYQSSEVLQAAVKELVTSHHRYCLTHNNLQLNNVFIPRQWENTSHKSIIKLINWENCSWGDPAFDLGTAIAGYLLLWLNSLILHPSIPLEKSLKLATIPLEVIQPSIVALTRAYLSSFPEVLAEHPHFLKRVVQFTGLALIYKIIEMIQSFQEFNSQGIWTLQLAKNLLCKPEASFKSVFGLTELALSESIFATAAR